MALDVIKISRRKSPFSSVKDHFFKLGAVTLKGMIMPAPMNCPALQGDEPRRGGGGLTSTGTQHRTHPRTT